MRWLAEVKYSSKARRLILIVPVPGRKRTRATASLRRPVVWLSGAGMCGVFPGLGLAAGGGDVEGLGLLGGVGVVGAGVDLQLGQLLAAQGVLGQHAPDGPAHHLLGLVLEERRVAALLQASPVPPVAIGELGLALVGGE